MKTTPLLLALALPISAQNLLPENPHQFGRSCAEVKNNGVQINVTPGKWSASHTAASAEKRLLSALS